MSIYVPLHVHSDASLLDGLAKPSQIARRCSDIGVPACALTDHGNISGAIRFMSAMKNKGMKPIIGCELYITPNDCKLKDGDRTLYHLVVLAKNLQGWKKLVKIVSASNHPDNFYYKPRLDLPTLAEYVGGEGDLIAFSGHMGSCLCACIFENLNDVNNCQTADEVKALSRANWPKIAIAQAEKLRAIFGKDNFFIEIQLVDSQYTPAAQILATGLRYVSKKTGIPCIGTPDAHYACQDDAFDQHVLLCSSMHTTLQEINHKKAMGEDVGMGAFFRSRNYHIPSYEEMIKFGNTEEELRRTIEIAEQCEEYDLKHKPMLPQFPCPDGMTSNKYMIKLLKEGWKKLQPKIQAVIAQGKYTEQDYRDRLNEEYKILTDVGLADYFLIVHDLIEWSHRNGQLTGAGRGSAAGSLVLYLLGVTTIDPIEHNLLFSRFYNEGRNTQDYISLPDVDMDFQRSARESVIDYLRQKYGHDKVSQMITFTRLQGRGALKEVMRVHGVASFEEMNRITQFIPDEAEISDQLQIMKEADKQAGGDGEASIIAWSLENHADDLKEWTFIDDEGNLQGPMAKMFEQSIRLEGTKKSQSKHAAGVIISQEPLAEVCPMVHDKTSGEMIAGMEMGDMEDMGHVKFDVLSVSMLDKVHGVMKLLEEGEL